MIEFTQDFRGKQTREQYYVAGTVVSLDGEIEAALVAEGRAKFVSEVPRGEQPKAVEVKRGKRKAKVG